MIYQPGQKVTWIGTKHLFERTVRIVAARESLDGTHTVYDIHDSEVIRGVVYAISESQLQPLATACADGHELVYDTWHYNSPRWVHHSILDLVTCTDYSNYENSGGPFGYTGRHRDDG